MIFTCCFGWQAATCASLILIDSTASQLVVRVSRKIIQLMGNRFVDDCCCSVTWFMMESSDLVIFLAFCRCRSCSGIFSHDSNSVAQSKHHKEREGNRNHFQRKSIINSATSCAANCSLFVWSLILYWGADLEMHLQNSWQASGQSCSGWWLPPVRKIFVNQPIIANIWEIENWLETNNWSLFS